MTSPVGSKRQVPDNAETSEPKRPETAVPIPSARAAISSSSSAISSSAMALLTAQPAHYRPLPNPEGFGPTLRRPRAVAAGRPDAPALPSQFLRRPVPNQDALHQPVALRRENRQGLPDSPYTAAQASALSSSSSSYASASFVRINADLNSVPAPSSQASAAIPDPSQFSEDPAISNFAAPGYVHPEQRESLVSISSRCPEPMQLPLPSHIYNKYAASAFVNNYYRIRNSIKHKTPFHLPIPRMNIRIESVGEKLGEGRNSIAYKCEVNGDIRGTYVLKIPKALHKKDFCGNEGLLRDPRELVRKGACQLRQYTQFMSVPLNESSLPSYIAQHLNFDPHLEKTKELLEDHKNSGLDLIASTNGFIDFILERVECPVLLVEYLPEPFPEIFDANDPWAKQLHEIRTECDKYQIVPDSRKSNLRMTENGKVKLIDLLEIEEEAANPLRNELNATFGKNELF